MINKSRQLIIFIWLPAVFLLAIAIWYSPVLFKGYSSGTMSPEVVIARNYAATGIYALEDDLNVAVAPELVKDKAVASSAGNRLGTISYAVIFKLFGWQNWNKLVLISAALHAIGLVIFTLTICYLFGWLAAVIFSLVYILLPFNWQTVHYLGFYEFALIYFSLFVFLYFWGRHQKLKSLCLILAGVFLGLTCLTREAFLVFLPLFLLWLWLGKEKREILLVFIPTGLLLMIFWLPGILGLTGANDYQNLFTVKGGQEIKRSDFNFYLLAYQDPYTFHFDRESVQQQLSSALADKKTGFLYRVSQLKGGANMGLRQVGILERLVVGTGNLVRHLSRYLAIEVIGGPLILILLLLGLWRLKKENERVYQLSLVCLLGTPLILSYVVLAVRNHLMDFGWIIATLVALGLMVIFPLLKDYLGINKYTKIIYSLVVILVLYSLLLANHVYFGRDYDSINNVAIMLLAQKVNSYAELINPSDVIAVGDASLHPTLNYFTNKSVVFFHPQTISKLIEQKELSSAFNKFGVKYIIGYNEQLSALILENTKVKNIANWPTPEEIRPALSYNQRWFLNLVR